MQSVHGGDIYSYTGKILDFSVNVNPLGTPKEVIKAGEESLKNITNYPDTTCRKLIAAIAENIGINFENIICGNGAAEIIFNAVFALKPKNVLLTVPTFAEYGYAADAVSAAKQYYYLGKNRDFSLDEGIINCIDNTTDMIFICNPNNPTGMCTEKNLLMKILDKCKQCNAITVIDECFIDFVCEGEKYSVLDCINRFDNLLVLKSFTKLYAMPGIRLGYGVCGNSEIIEAMYRYRQPWNVSSVAQAMGIAALKDNNELIKKTRRYISYERAFLSDELKRLGIEIFNSRANYIMFKADNELDKRLLSKNILIRNCSNYYGLNEGYYRIAVRGHKDNIRLIKAISEVM